MIDKKDYLSAMEKSPSDDKPIKDLVNNALTDKINDREIFMKGIDYSYYVYNLFFMRSNNNFSVNMQKLFKRRSLTNPNC